MKVVALEDAVLIAIKAIKEAEKTKWINFLEQLPEKEQEIIVYFKNSAGWHITSAYWDGYTIIELCERCGYREPWGYQAIATHWMPMPDAPQLV